MINSDLLYKIAFSQLYGIGPARAQKILNQIDHPKDFFFLDFKELHRITEIPLPTLKNTNPKSALISAQAQLNFLNHYKVNYHFISDPSYPKRLRQCPDAPIGIFFRGCDPNWNRPKCIAIVGSREQTNYGIQIVEELISKLPKDIIVLSGLAKGIDACVHQKCIEFGMSTYGVLGHGLDQIYPKSNRQIASLMLENGGLISEFLIGVKPEKMNFPMRNRIIAGMADAVIVVESKKNGGSLITADLANDYNREVFAFPNQIFNLESEGCHQLIANHKAHLITSANDLLKFMNWSANTQQLRSLNELQTNNLIQKKIISCFQIKPSWSIDELLIEINQPVSLISGALFELELQNFIKNKGANRYSLPL